LTHSSTQADRLAQCKSEAARRVHQAAGDLIRLSHEIHAHPELGFEEHRASAWVGDMLAAAGLSLQAGVADLETSLIGTTGCGQLALAICAEYDALPVVGHACGHNVIAAAAVGAAVALGSMADEYDLTVKVLGTPAEEGGGGKVLMLERGAFDGVHGAMMVHPAPYDARHMRALARARFQVRYKGKAAHASMFPQHGRNAADALVVAQVGIGLLRQHLPAGEQVHGIVTEAGFAPAIVPESSVASYVARAPRAGQLDQLLKRLYACFEAGAIATGTDVVIEETTSRYTHFMPHQGMSACYVRNARDLGRRFGYQNARKMFGGSTDMANVSLFMPAIHPMIGIGSAPAVNHQPEFAAACIRADADQAILDGAVAMAWTVLDLAADRDMRAALLARTSARAVPGESASLPPG
jgi:amidohydrolase